MHQSPHLNDHVCQDVHVFDIYGLVQPHVFSSTHFDDRAFLVIRRKPQFVVARSSGVSEAPFVNFTTSKIFDHAKEPLRFFYHMYIWQVPPQLSCGDTCQTCALTMLKNSENNGMEEIGLVTSTPGLAVRVVWHTNIWQCTHRMYCCKHMNLS